MTPDTLPQASIKLAQCLKDNRGTLIKTVPEKVPWGVSVRSPYNFLKGETLWSKKKK